MVGPEPLVLPLVDVSARLLGDEVAVPDVALVAHEDDVRSHRHRLAGLDGIERGAAGKHVLPGYTAADRRVMLELLQRWERDRIRLGTGWRRPLAVRQH